MYYADRIYQINLAIAGIAIGTVLLPKLSEYVEKKNFDRINYIQDKSLELSLFLSLPAMFALLVAPKEITSSLFGYGSFDVESVENSSKALFYFAFGVPAFALIKIFSTFLFARHNTKVPFYFSIFSVLLNIFISITFFNKIGFIIIPISTTISSWSNAILLFLYLNNKKYFSINSKTTFSFIKILCSSSISVYLFYLFLTNFPFLFVYENNLKLLYMLIVVIFIILIYVFVSVLTKTFKLSDIKLKY